MIRSYTDNDLDELLEVWYEASLVAHSFLTEEFFATERRQVTERWLPVAETLVYETDGRVEGSWHSSVTRSARSLSSPGIRAAESVVP